MAEFTITEVHGSEDWGDDGQYGPKRTWKLSLDGPDGKTEDGTVAELAQKRESPAPTVGQTLNGTLSFDKGRWRFKKDKPANGGGGFKGGKSPQERAEIRRLASHKAAVALLALEVQAGLTFGEGDKSAAVVLGKRIEFFDGDAKKAGENA